MHAEVGAKGALDLLTFVQTKKSRVNENARELIGDGAMHKCSGHR
jgi:hypothetical protein